MDYKNFWELKLSKYSKKDWISKPSIFATAAIKYFPKSGRLLELGAGLGQDSRYFASRGYQVTCTDFSERALKYCRKKAKEEKIKINIENVNLSRNLPYKDNQFDVVYSHMSLHYWDDEWTRNLFEEIRRILKNDGIFATILNTIGDPETKRFKRVGKRLYKHPTGITKRYFSLDDVRRLTKDKYDCLLLDNKGETYKDEIKSLIRFVGRKK